MVDSNGKPSPLYCETPSGMLYGIPKVDESFVTENFGNGPFVPGETIITFTSRPMLNITADTIITSSSDDLELTMKKVPRGGSKNYYSSFGTKTILVVRVIASDAQTTATEAQLSDAIFGTHGDPVNLKSQYLKCSHQQLNFIPAKARPGITDGVTTVSLNSPSFKKGHEAMRDEISPALNIKFGVRAPYLLADHLIFCLPPGAMLGNMAGIGGIRNWYSAYEDEQCRSLNTPMHEISHNFGMGHANEGGIEYEDKSGVVSLS